MPPTDAINQIIKSKYQIWLAGEWGPIDAQSN